MQTTLAAWEMSRQKIPEGYQKSKYKMVTGKEGDDSGVKVLRDGKPEHLVFGALAQAGGKKELIDVRSNCPIDPCLTSNPVKDHFLCYHLLTFPFRAILVTEIS